jgi:uncharacterized membrane protein
MKTKNLILCALFIGLSVALSYVVLPSPTGTIAFDSLPGFVAGAVLGPVYGGVVGLLGHLATSLKVGFPLGLLSHLIIGGFMFLATYVFGYFYRINQKKFGTGLAILINGVFSLVPFGFMIGWGFVLGMVVPLLVASAANVFIALFVSKYVEKVA